MCNRRVDCVEPDCTIIPIGSSPTAQRCVTRLEPGVNRNGGTYRASWNDAERRTYNLNTKSDLHRLRDLRQPVHATRHYRLRPAGGGGHRGLGGNGQHANRRPAASQRRRSGDPAPEGRPSQRRWSDAAEHIAGPKCSKHAFPFDNLNEMWQLYIQMNKRSIVASVSGGSGGRE